MESAKKNIKLYFVVLNKLRAHFLVKFEHLIGHSCGISEIKQVL